MVQFRKQSGRRSLNDKRRGATTVEFSLCLPILLLFVFGIMEFSRITQLQQSVRLATFEGARAGIPLNATTADVQNAVNGVMSALSISNFQTTISPSPLTYTSSSVTVTVALDPTQNAWITWFARSSNTIDASVTLLREVQSVSVP
ncbi:TadE/TadG family type IV pilus assembly protein [Schlesneria paludicola]|uniref:TadE/TadG family type IV pilus assembly protein n=1 Tax=Schlesneria paludicola TaxID=360056 RepID=UPI00029ABF96|nr:TadE/TadG family type IV pilus assembly protein [Schlesneria paludicola]